MMYVKEYNIVGSERPAGGRLCLPVVLAVCILVLSLLSGIPARAQSGVTVKVRLEEASSGEPVGYVAVSLTKPGEDVSYKYALTDTTGLARIVGVGSGTYTLRAELLGYRTVEQDIKVTGRSLDLGTISLEEDSQTLEAATVTSSGNPVVVKQDTIEFNATSFKSSDNDMLESLLKKLPGVEVDTDGTVTVNGETVTKITIDGKTFFLDDPTLATKNIPAKIIEKVKVVDKKSDQALFTGIDDGERETVIDLTVHKGMLNGWFGSAMGGGGHDIPASGTYGSDGTSKFSDGWRYQGAAMMGRFTENTQLTVILNANNTNNRGFSDLSSTMMQSMRGARGIGQNAGAVTYNGITKSWMAGTNGAFTLFDGDMDLSANYVYNGSDKAVEEESRKITYLDDGSNLIYDDAGYNLTASQGHRFGARLEHRFSEMTSILFEPQVNFGYGNFNEYSVFSTDTDPGDGSDPILTNSGFTESTGSNRNWTTTGSLLLRQKFEKPGRTFSARINYTFSGNTLNGFNQSYTDNDAASEGDEEIVNQRYVRTARSTYVYTRLAYTEPFAPDFFLETSYAYSINRRTTLKDTYDSGSDILSGYSLAYDPDGETYSDTYSSTIINLIQNHTAGVNVMYQKEGLHAQVGVNVKPTVTDNQTNGQSYHSSVTNASPQVNFSYRIGEYSNIRFYYNGNVSQPSTTQLMPVADNSDPLDISFGNPYLEPYFTHNMRAIFGYTNKETFTSVQCNATGNIISNAITNAIWYDSNGAQYTFPLNGPTSGNVEARVTVNSPIHRSNFSVYMMVYGRYSESMSYVGKTEGGRGDELIADYYDPETGELDYEAFHRDFFTDDGSSSREFSDYFSDSGTQTFTSTERLRFTYRDDAVEVRLGAQARVSKSWYTISSYNQDATWNNMVDASLNWTIPYGFNLVFESTYNWYDGYTTKQDDSFVVNTEFSKLLCNDKLTLAAKAYDIFNQAKSLYVTDRSNYHREVRNNTLGRYIIISLTFRFGNFNTGH